MDPKSVFGKLGKEGKRILNLLQKTGPLTKNDLLTALNTNFTTLNRFMRPLKEARLIAEVGIGASSGGRKPVLYDVNPARFNVLGVDISRLYTRLVVTDLKMRILFKKSIAMDERHTPEKTVETLGDMFEEAIRGLGIEKDRFIGVGLGTVGPLDREAGLMLQPKNFAAPGWTNVPIREMLESALGLPVKMDNGANTAILAEYIYGRGRGYRNIAYFYCGTGIRTGAISAGTIVRTIYDAEDAFGHTVVDVDGPPCSCGSFGCIDCFASVYAIEQKFKSLLKQGRSTNITKTIDAVDYTDICRAAERGDLLAKEIITNAATIFGVGLANYIKLLNPGLVILSGPLISQSKQYYQTSTEVASKRLFYRKNEGIVFSRGGEFGEDAIALGAAGMVMESCLA